MRYLFLLLIALSFSQCKIDNQEVKGKPKIVCTTSIAADLVEQITGDKAEVSYLMGPGVDPHEYVPTLKDSEKLAEADIIVYHGLNLEAKMSDDLAKVKKNKKITINLCASLDHHSLIDEEGEDHSDHALDSDHGSDHSHGPVDPHTWNDVNNWIQVCDHLAVELGKYNSENKETFTQNAESYKKELKELDKELENQFNDIPEKSRVLVTAHDAFGYLCRRYGLSPKSLQGISTAAEFGIKDVTNLADFLMQNNIKSIFLETSVPSKNLQAVINHCKEKGHDVSIAGKLYSDALGDKNSGASTYVDMMRTNTNTIVNGLQ